MTLTLQELYDFSSREEKDAPLVIRVVGDGYVRTNGLEDSGEGKERRVVNVLSDGGTK